MFFVYVEGEFMFMGFKEIAVSSGSACTSVFLELFYVLCVFGVNEEMVYMLVRYGLGWFIIEVEVDCVIEVIVR